jgi:hypothetical protein
MVLHWDNAQFFPEFSYQCLFGRFSFHPMAPDDVPHPWVKGPIWRALSQENPLSLEENTTNTDLGHLGFPGFHA